MKQNSRFSLSSGCHTESTMLSFECKDRLICPSSFSFNLFRNATSSAQNHYLVRSVFQDLGSFSAVPCFRIWGHFPPFRVLGFGVIFRRSVLQDLGSFSAVPCYRIWGHFPPFRRSGFQGRPYKLRGKDQTKNKWKYVLEKSDSKECKASLECRKKLNVKQTVQRRSNNWAKLTKYSSCTSSRQYFLKPPEILQARGTRRWKFHLGDLSNQQHYNKGIIVVIPFISFVYLCRRRSQRLQCSAKTLLNKKLKIVEGEGNSQNLAKFP